MKIPPAGEWTFNNEDIAAKFDRHVREQLPWYDLATGIVTAVGRHFISVNGLVIDTGASTGNIGRALAPILEDRKATLVGIEPSAEMASRYEAPGLLVQADARKVNFQEYGQPDLIVCFLLLMFIPVPDRPALISRMKAAVAPGGALLIFDKTVPQAGDVGALTLRLTLGAKYEAGATADEIIAKELSLAGVQRPLYPAELDDFAPIFRFGDFGGWLWAANA